MQPFADSSYVGQSYPARLLGQQFLGPNGPPSVTIYLQPSTNPGPTVTEPTQFSYTFYQYVPIQPIVVRATERVGGGISFFVLDSDLPTGITFDATTSTISGVSVNLGQRSFNLYVKDTQGITVLTFHTNTILPRVIRQQTGAGAWTSLVRQYTVVNAAQNSVNGHVLPANEATLGEFIRPEPPDSVSASNCPKC
jgi:hypothetical protein